MHLIGSSLSPYVARVTLQLALKGQSIEVLPRPGQPGSPEMAAENPFGKIPVLVTESGNLIDSVAIMEYLEGLYSECPLLPSDPFELARMRALIYSFDQYVLPPQLPLYYKLMGMPTTDDDVSNARDGMSNAMGKLAGLVDESGRFISSDSFALSDCALAPFFSLIGEVCARLHISSPLVDSPVFANWWERVRSDEPVQDMSKQLVAALDELVGD